MNLLHSIDALERVLQLNDNIASLSLARFALLPPGDQRATLDDASKNAVLRARELRTSLKLPFWDAAMLMTVNGSGKTPGLFAAAAFHNKPLRPLISIARSDLSSAPLSDVPQDEILAVLSKVQMQDRTSRPCSTFTRLQATCPKPSSASYCSFWDAVDMCWLPASPITLSA